MVFLQLFSHPEGHIFMSRPPSSFEVILRFTEGSIYAPCAFHFVETFYFVENAVCTLSISLERMGIFWLNCAALIQVSIETFEISIFKIYNICTCAHCNYLLLRIIYMIWISWHKLTLGIHYDKWSWSMMSST